MKWTPNEMLQALKPLSAHINPEIADLPLGICTDNRKLQINEFFVCLRGERFDAHDFASQITVDQCPLVVVEQSWLDQGHTPQGSYIAVENTTLALGQLAHYGALKLSARRISITGSNGKTTTKEMLNHVLSQSMQGIATRANNNNHIGVPLTLFELEANSQYAIIEIGTNHSGEIAYGSQIAAPHIALINNIGDSHLEFFKNRDNVFVEKISMRDSLQAGGLLILNADDPYLAQVKAKEGERLLNYGINSGDLKPQNLSFDEELCAHFEIEGIPVRLQIPGQHNLYNALAVILAARECGLDMTEIASALGEFRGSAGRTEMLNWAGATLISDCYNANPSSMRMALEILNRKKCTGRRIAVIGDMFELGEQGPEAHRAIGDLIGQLSLDCVWTLGELCLEIHHKVPGSLHFQSQADLLEHLQKSIKSQDLVLFKASNGMKFQPMIRELLSSGAPHA